MENDKDQVGNPNQDSGNEVKDLAGGSSENLAAVEATDGVAGLDAFARAVVKRIADAALELAFVRHSLTSDEYDEENYPGLDGVDSWGAFLTEIKEDTFNCLTGDDFGCLDPEDLDESNCELIWLKAQLTGEQKG